MIQKRTTATLPNQHRNRKNRLVTEKQVLKIRHGVVIVHCPSRDARLAQLVEHYLDTVGVTGSSPVLRTIFLVLLCLLHSRFSLHSSHSHQFGKNG